jgi:hypothetical protein
VKPHTTQPGVKDLGDTDERAELRRLAEALDRLEALCDRLSKGQTGMSLRALVAARIRAAIEGRDAG